MSPLNGIALLPDSGPLITLAYADALDLLFLPGWQVMLVDAVLHEVTRNQTPTSDKLAAWAAAVQIPVVSTNTFEHLKQAALVSPPKRRRNLGELAIQETMSAFALKVPPTTAVFLFEDHKIARASFLVPDTCQKISTRAFLIFLEQRGFIDSSAEIERRAIKAGRDFSSLRFPLFAPTEN